MTSIAKAREKGPKSVVNVIKRRGTKITSAYLVPIDAQRWAVSITVQGSVSMEV